MSWKKHKIKKDSERNRVGRKVRIKRGGDRPRETNVSAHLLGISPVRLRTSKMHRLMMYFPSLTPSLNSKVRGLAFTPGRKTHKCLKSSMSFFFGGCPVCCFHCPVQYSHPSFTTPLLSFAHYLQYEKHSTV